MQISVIIPCKGRLEHLKQCLPTVLAQSKQPLEIIIVDQKCPDKVSKWVKELDNPMVRAVKSTPKDQYFNLSKARNDGYRAAKGDMLFFCDADTILSPYFFQENFKAYKDGSFMCGWGHHSSSGNCIVSRAMFEHPAIRGYNEVLTGWGAEEIVFYARMEAAGFRRIPFVGFTDNIKHSDELRVEHYQRKDMWATNDENFHTASITWEGI